MQRIESVIFTEKTDFCKIKNKEREGFKYFQEVNAIHQLFCL